MEMAILNLR